MLSQEAHNYRTKVLIDLYESMHESSRKELLDNMEIDGPGFNPIKSPDDYKRREGIILTAIRDPDSDEFYEAKESLVQEVWQYADGNRYADNDYLALCFMFTLIISSYEEEFYDAQDVLSYLDFSDSLDKYRSKQCATLFRLISDVARREDESIEIPIADHYGETSSLFELLARSTLSSVYDDGIDPSTFKRRCDVLFTMTSNMARIQVRDAFAAKLGV